LGKSISRPQNSSEEVVRLVRDAYALGESLAVEPLPGDRDSNWKVLVDGRPFGVLKVFSPLASRAWIELEERVLGAAAAAGLPVPRVVPAADQRTVLAWEGTFARMVTWLEGRPLGDTNPVRPAHARALGHVLGRLGRTLRPLDTTGAPDAFAWDMMHADTTVGERMTALTAHPHLPEAGLTLVQEVLDHFVAQVKPVLAGLPRQLIHNDANDWNVLVQDDAISGLLDFGDVVAAPRVIDVAVAAAYAAMDRTDPVAFIGETVAGYHAENPLEEQEVALVADLVRMRLVVSVAMSAWRRQSEPDDPYLTISETSAWTLLHRLAALHPRFVHYRLRAACGMEPVPGSRRIGKWLKERTGTFPAVIRPALSKLGADQRASSPVLFDFSVSSLEFGPVDLTVPGAAEDEIWRRCGDAVGIGRYAEARLAYTGVQFATETGARRTIHIGIDLFRPAGCAVHAPLEGTVQAARIHEEQFDYGGCVILEHTIEGLPTFWTLYGHLSHATVLALTPGQRISPGEAFAELGAWDENGGWVAHLHFEVITDLLDMDGTYPGVASPDEADVWKSLSINPSDLLGLGLEATAPPPPRVDALLERRRAVLGPNLSLAYRPPLHIARGIMQYLYDPEGRAYLDAVNNVAHVGHQNLAVTRAVSRQVRTQNTNTRYLHETVLVFAERLLETLPDHLEVVYLVNSGSEANDLALRVARTATGREDVLVLEGAYHGHLGSLISVSPYKYDGPGGTGRPRGTWTVPMPDAYRGAFRGHTEESGLAYAAQVAHALETAAAAGQPIAAFLAESVPGCGGQIVPPPGYLRQAAEYVRAAGGVVILDEVQVGMGRPGDAFWGFALQDAHPDMVVIGKPVGNGHPLGIVAMTRQLADAFNTGMEYFNTFGGNAVSAAAGLAVLAEIRDRDLQAHARDVGAHLMDGLRGLQRRYPLIGDVRGVGLFVGVELVLDRGTLEPAADAARYIANRMAEMGVLLSTDGPLNNVLKIKPPMVFTRQNADFLVHVLERVLQEDAVQLSR
jgi:4-aminobutyrate aminotransferase-like enzyme/Ser/Thr protein kinase RdoA (MazF antagonist)/murein DD-endopeptidase MepM/ murein hydrolase activator NlpD